MHQKRLASSLVAAALVAVATVSSLNAQPIITNGSFELPGFSDLADVTFLGSYNTDMTGWSVSDTYGRPIEWVKEPTYSAQDGSY